MAVFVVRRRTATKGVRWHVRYQLGRGEPQVHLGVFGSLEEARAREWWARMELASGRVPDRRRITAKHASVDQEADAWLASRVDLAESSVKAYTARLARVRERFGERDPRSISVAEVQAWVIGLSHDLQPASVGLTLNALCVVLDFARVEQNPCRDALLRRPRRQRSEMLLPTRSEILKLHAQLPDRYREAVRLLEEGGLRIHEACNLRWRDIDRERGRLLVAASKTAAGRRWVTVDLAPEWELPPGGTDGLLFPGVTPDGVRAAIRRACKHAGIRHIHPHALRHLHASRLLHEGWSPADIAARLGHASPATTLSLYSHQIVPD